MARTTFDHSIFADIRFFNLSVRLGSKRTAIGAMVEAWVLAQRFVTPDAPDGPIPHRDWITHQMAPEIIEVGLAHVREDGCIHVAGGREQFAWLVQKQNASRRGGESNKKRLKEQSKRSEPVDNPHEQEAYRLTPAPGGSPLSLTLSLTQTKKQESIDRGAAAPAVPVSIPKPKKVKEPKPEVNLAIGRLIGTYVKGWQTARKVPASCRPDTSAAPAIFRKLLKDKTEEQVSILIQVFCQMKDPWFEKQAWDIRCFAMNTSKVALAMQRGDSDTVTDWDYIRGESSNLPEPV